MLLGVWEKEDSVVAEASAEHTLSLLALKGLHVPLEGVGLHLVKRVVDTLLNRLRQAEEIPFGVIGKVTNPALSICVHLRNLRIMI